MDEDDWNRRIIIALMEGVAAGTTGVSIAQRAPELRYGPRTAEGDAFEEGWNFGAGHTATRESDVTARSPELASPLPLDFIVRVNRKDAPPYPGWSGKVMRDDLERIGPTEYDLRSDVEQWLPFDRKTGTVRIYTIYGYLKKNDMLADQLGLVDLLAIQAKGVAVFRALFMGKAVFGWKRAVCQPVVRDLSVPYLCELGGKVVLGWQWGAIDCGPRNPALRFRPNVMSARSIGAGGT